MKNLEREILETEIIWNDNVPDRWEWFEIYTDGGQVIIDHTTRFSIRYEDQGNGHGEREYGVRNWIISLLLEVLNDIKDEKIKVVFCYNYDYSGDETFDWKIIVNRKKLIKIIKKSIEEASK